jgi:hypothetical protein
VAELPVIQVSVWAGIGEENKKKVVEGMMGYLKNWAFPQRQLRHHSRSPKRQTGLLVDSYISEKFANRWNPSMRLSKTVGRLFSYPRWVKQGKY